MLELFLAISLGTTISDLMFPKAYTGTYQAFKMDNGEIMRIDTRTGEFGRGHLSPDGRRIVWLPLKTDPLLQQATIRQGE